jgi:membrane protein DedA with SNARE-associated domain
MYTASSLISDISQHGTIGAFCGVVLLSYLLEDVALILAAVLAISGVLSPLIGWTAAFVGIFTGDLGVYFIARLLRKPVAGWKTDFPMPSTKELILCRFTPGLRTPAYSLCGLSQMPLFRFSQIIFWSGLVWTLAIFSLVYWSGEQTAKALTHTNWLVIPVVVGLIVWMRLRWKPSFLRKELVSHD